MAKKYEVSIHLLVRFSLKADPEIMVLNLKSNMD